MCSKPVIGGPASTILCANFSSLMGGIQRSSSGLGLSARRLRALPCGLPSPTFYQCLRFLGRSGCRNPVEHTLNTEILVDIRPVDTMASPNQPPFRALRRGGFRQSPRPRQRYADHTTVPEMCNDFVVGDADILNAWIVASHNVHAKPTE